MTDTTAADGSGPFTALEHRVKQLEHGRDELTSEVRELKELVGRAPDASTGREGSGLSGVVSQLVTRRSLVGASAIGGGGGVAAPTPSPNVGGGHGLVGGQPI